MKRAIRFTLVPILLAGVALLLWPRTSASTDATSPSATGAQAIEREPSAWLTIAPPRGSLRVEGIVENADGPVAGATVTATSAHGADVLSDLDCQCHDHCGRKLLDSDCFEAADQLVELVATRTSEASPLARATTGPDGRFVLSGLPDETLTLWAEAPTGIAVDTAVAPGNTSLALTLSEGRMIRGNVRRVDAAPIAGALVTAIFARHSRFFDAVTDAKGHFAIGPVPEGAYSVVASRPGLLPEHRRVLEDDPSELELTLMAARQVSGVVLRDSAPAAGVEVKLVDGRRDPKAITDAKGRFHFAGVRKGRHHLTAATKNEARSVAANVADTEDLTDLEIELEAVATWAGVVVDENGQPIVHAEVSAGEGIAMSDKDGRFEFNPLSADPEQVVVTAHGYIRLQVPRRALTEPRDALRLMMARASLISGVVVDTEGHPVVGAGLSECAGNMAGVSYQSAETGDGGRFEMWGVAGPCQVQVTAKGYLTLKTTLRLPSSGERLTLDEGASVSGVVLDVDGGPAQAHRVVLTSFESDDDRAKGIWHLRRRRGADTSTDRLGAFSIRGIPAGNWRIAAEKPVRGEGAWSSSPHAEVTLEHHSRKTVTLRFAAGLKVAGRVVDGEGEAISEGTVTLSHGGGETGRTGIVDGAFSFEGVEPGAVTLGGAARDGREGQLEARAGDTELTLRLTEGDYIEGRVVGDEGMPLTTFEVQHERFKKPDGRFRMRSARYMEITIQASGYAAQTVAVPNQLGPNNLGDVRLSRGRMVMGRVIDAATKEPIAGVLVDWGSKVQRDSIDVSREHGAVETDRAGAFRINRVGDQARVLLAKHPLYVAHAQPLDAASSVTVSLIRAGSLRVNAVGRAGQAVEAFEISARGPDGRVAYESWPINRLEGLAPGAWTVIIRHPTKLFHEQAVTIAVGDQSTVINEATDGVQLTATFPAEREGHAILLRGTFDRLDSTPVEFVILNSGEPATVSPGRWTFFLLRIPGQYYRQDIVVTEQPIQSVTITPTDWVDDP